jgi:hypothetical protein
MDGAEAIRVIWPIAQNLDFNDGAIDLVGHVVLLNLSGLIMMPADVSDAISPAT